VNYHTTQVDVMMLSFIDVIIYCVDMINVVIFQSRVIIYTCLINIAYIDCSSCWWIWTRRISPVLL